MIAVGWIGQQIRRLGPSRAVAALSLAVVCSLMLLMVAVVVVQTKRFDTPGTQSANLGPWSRSAVPLRVPLPLSEAAGLWLLRGDVHLQNARVKEQSRAAFDGFGGPFAVPLHSVERIDIAGARIWLNAGREPRGVNHAPENAAINYLLEPLQRMAFETLGLQAAQLTTQRPGGEQQTIERLDAEVRAVAGSHPTSASGKFHYRGEPVAFEANLRPVASRTGRWSMSAHIVVTSRHLSATFDGLVQFESGMRLNGNLALRAANLSALSQWLGVPLPTSVAAGSFSAKGGAVWRDGLLTFEQVDAELDGQTAHGALTIGLTGPRPFIDGALAFNRLDVAAASRWLGLASSVGGANDIAASGLATGPARWPVFDAIDADLRLSATQLIGLDPRSGRLAASVTAKDGRLVIDIADMEFADGAGAGQITIDQQGKTPFYHLRGSVVHADAATVLAFAHLPALLTGVANIRFELSGRGRTWAETAAASTGEIQIALPAAGRMQLDLTRLLADARDRKSFAFGTHQLQGSAFDLLDVRLAVRHGTLISEHMSVRQNGLLVTADGTLQTHVGRLYLRLMTDHGQGLARTARFGRSQSVLLHGEIANPRVLLEEPAGLQAPAPIVGPQAAPLPP